MVIQGITSRLLHWQTIESSFAWEAILVGNGASLAVWDAFGYESLFQQALSDRIAHPLTVEDYRVFKCLRTRNFERVLTALNTSRLVAGAMGQPIGEINRRYRSIQRALIEAVTAIHIPWPLMPPRALTKIRRALEFYEFVFSTNYDLLIYWAIMSRDRGRGFVDGMWNQPFDPTDDWGWAEGKTKVLYLHGGIHLYRQPTGGTIKRKAEAANLLSLFGQPLHGSVPLFITEGTHEDKVAAIHRNDYLAFGFERLATHNRPLAILGHSLASPDRHLLEAIRRSGTRRMAIGLLRGSPEAILKQKAHFVNEFRDAHISFFDAQTHPLGDPDLKVRPQ